VEALSTLPDADLRSALEALLLVSTDPVPAADLAQAAGVPTARAAEALRVLAREYAAAGRGFQLREVAGGWRLYTHPAHHELVEGFVRSWDTHRLTQAALETLAVIAYTQPATREGVKAVRGVSSDSAISSLVDKGLVREAGRTPSGAVLYATTATFLEKFGLKSPRELPPLEDFAPDEETRRLIRDRLGTKRAADPLGDEGGNDDETGGEL
jgi:segregation and condensation protein B